jgi:hypothetical protein
VDAYPSAEDAPFWGKLSIASRTTLSVPCGRPLQRRARAFIYFHSTGCGAGNRPVSVGFVTLPSPILACDCQARGRSASGA